MKRNFIIFLLFCLFSSIVYSYDLGNIEDTFIKNGKVTCYVVVANKGSASDALAQVEIITYLGKFSKYSTVGVEKLVSDITDIYEKDIISIGNPCINNITKEIMNYTGNCRFEEGLMQFYHRNGRDQLVIFAPTERATREAVKAITSNEAEGQKEVIEITAEEKLEIKENEEQKQPEQPEEIGVIEQLPEIEQTPEIEVEIEPQPEQTPEPSFWSKITGFFKRLFRIK